MPNSLTANFAAAIRELDASLAQVPERLADVPWRAGGWTRKQVLGHMLDSAANNHQRFVRAALEGGYTGPAYAQQGWVDAHGYAAHSWPTLLAWWRTYHQILCAVVERIPEARLEAPCVVGADAPVTLRFLIEDYLVHQRHHLAQLRS